MSQMLRGSLNVLQWTAVRAQETVHLDLVISDGEHFHIRRQCVVFLLVSQILEGFCGYEGRFPLWKCSICLGRQQCASITADRKASFSVWRQDWVELKLKIESCLKGGGQIADKSSTLQGLDPFILPLSSYVNLLILPRIEISATLGCIEEKKRKKTLCFCFWQLLKNLGIPNVKSMKLKAIRLDNLVKLTFLCLPVKFKQWQRFCHLKMSFPYKCNPGKQKKTSTIFPCATS